MSRKLLMISFNYPPQQASSGLLRSLSFSREAAASGWDTEVVTAATDIGNRLESEDRTLVPEGLSVKRTFAVDLAARLAIFGRYPVILEIPDRYASWIFSASWRGFGILRKRKNPILYTTYPTASAHAIGIILSRFTGSAWVADFRDPMVMDGHPATYMRRWAHAIIEKYSIKYCDVALFTTEQTLKAYRKKFPNIPQEKFRVIENGYDDNLFKLALQRREHEFKKHDGKLILLHSGSLYPEHRNPLNFFSALAKIKEEKLLIDYPFKVILRGTGFDSIYKPVIESLGITDLVELAPEVSYLDSISEMLRANGLLLFQGKTCNEQIPAKLYEYLHTELPILAVTDNNGAAASLLKGAGIQELVQDTDAEAIKEAVVRFLINGVVNRSPDYVPDRPSRDYSRRSGAILFCKILDGLYCAGAGTEY